MELSVQELISALTNKAPARDPLVGRYVVCRCYSAGVHAGELVHQEGDVALLSAARRLWNWKTKEGVALNGVAQHGIEKGCKVDSTVDLIRLTGVIETIACSDKGKESIRAA